MTVRLAYGWRSGGPIDRARRHLPPHGPFGAVRGRQDAHGGTWRVNLDLADLVARHKRGEMVPHVQRLSRTDRRLLWLWVLATVVGALAVVANKLWSYPN